MWIFFVSTNRNTTVDSPSSAIFPPVRAAGPDSSASRDMSDPIAPRRHLYVTHDAPPAAPPAADVLGARVERVADDGSVVGSVEIALPGAREYHEYDVHVDARGVLVAPAALAPVAELVADALLEAALDAPVDGRLAREDA
jgi:hypothetical protein